MTTVEHLDALAVAGTAAFLVAIVLTVAALVHETRHGGDDR